MAMFGRSEDWGLQAVVDLSNNMDKTENIQEQDDQNFLLASSSIVLGDGLETLYKPFYPVKNSSSTDFRSPISSISSTSTPEVVKKEVQEVQLIIQNNNQEMVEPDEDSVILDQSSSSVLAIGYPPRFKKRKSQQRVTIQVKAEDHLSCDMWAWRKYGKNSVNGSRHPRSYYRCRTMKGCRAIKEVEQSCTDPDMYIVTYKAEHCHSPPTRMNSLAENPSATGVSSFPPLTSNDEISSKSPAIMNQSSDGTLPE